jgi:putative acetyltransferase
LDWERRWISSYERNPSKNNHIHLIYAEVSITAKPFFEKSGFRVVTQQTIVRNGVELINFKMERIV